MSLDLSFYAVRRTNVFDTNMTHNLAKMARECGIYQFLWNPQKLPLKGSDLITPLEHGLEMLRANPAYFQVFSATNGWGTYEQFVPWVEQVLAAAKENPDAEVEANI